MISSILILGIGNRMRQDDAVGPLVIDDLKEQNLPSYITLMEDKGEPANLIEAWKEVDIVLLIDSVLAGEPAGTIHELDLSQTSLPNVYQQTSSHAVGLGDAIELARAMKKLPPRVIFYGIEAQNFEIGEGLSAPVNSALETIKSRIIDKVTEITQ